MTRTNTRTTRLFAAPLRHLGRNLVAYIALFLALGGSSLAAGKLLTGADIQDDSLTGADIVETSLAQVRAATDSDRLGGTLASEFVQVGDDLADGLAAKNLWGPNKWAPPGTTQRGYARLQVVYGPVVSASFRTVADGDAFEWLSYPTPLAPGATVEPHVIRVGEPAPEGCGGSIEQPEADPGHLCVFHDFEPEDYVYVGVSNQAPRYGASITMVPSSDAPTSEEFIGGGANVVWAMSPPKPERR